MSEISKRIRAYVNDTSVSDEYGAWGALRPDQRRQIRELCDTCDMYEEIAEKDNPFIDAVVELTKDMARHSVMAYTECRAEAFKEMAESLKKHARSMCTHDISGENWMQAVPVETIDKAVKKLIERGKPSEV